LDFIGLIKKETYALIEEDINIRIAEAFAEMGDDEFVANPYLKIIVVW
jgi:hypothetical protein